MVDCIPIGFRKPSFSDRFLNFHFQHLFTHKKGILSLIDRVILLSHHEFHKENFDCAIKVLNNGYPLDLIFSTTRRRLYSIINHKHYNRKEPENTSSYFIIPYVSFIAKKFYLVCSFINRS